jgi:hypothetical protein
MIQQAVAIVKENPGWNWAVMISTAAAAWLAPVAGIVTIGCGVLHAYIAWQKYKHWQKSVEKADDDAGS